MKYNTDGNLAALEEHLAAEDALEKAEAPIIEARYDMVTELLDNNCEKIIDLIIGDCIYGSTFDGQQLDSDELIEALFKYAIKEILTADGISMVSEKAKIERCLEEAAERVAEKEVTLS